MLLNPLWSWSFWLVLNKLKIRQKKSQAVPYRTCGLCYKTYNVVITLLVSYCSILILFAIMKVLRSRIYNASVVAAFF